MGFAVIDWRTFDWQVARANLTEFVDHPFVHGPWRMVYPQTYDTDLANLAWVRVDEGFGSGLNTYRTNLRRFPHRKYKKKEKKKWVYQLVKEQN